MANDFRVVTSFAKMSFRAGLFNFCIASSSSTWTSFECWAGVNSGKRQCWGKRSNDPHVQIDLVSGTKKLQL